MGSVLGSFARAAMGLVALMCLAGCGGLYAGMANLEDATAAVQPIATGSYTNRSGEAAQISLDENGTYHVTGTTDDEMPVRIYGPVSGLYVAQIEGLKENEKGLFGYAILKISAQSIDLAGDATMELGGMLFDRLGIPRPDGAHGVSMLPDNAHLNWALLQEFIVTYRNQLVFEPLYTRSAS